MPSFLVSVGTAFGGVLLQMLLKSLGYEMIVKASVIAADAWADSTKTDKDNLVVDAWGRAMGAPDDLMDKLKESASVVQ